jgi:hypothetical protein
MIINQAEIDKIKRCMKLDVPPIQSPVRYRYKSEGKDTGGKLCARADEKTSAAIHFECKLSYEFLVTASCVTADDKHYPHPHKLVGGKNSECQNGVYVHVCDCSKSHKYDLR